MRRDRAVVLAAIVAITGLAWAYMVYEAHKMNRTGVCECLGLAMSGPDVRPWASAAILPLFLMWAEMMVAMMLPSAAPILLTFATVNRQRRLQNRPFVSTAFFAGGYLTVWTVFSVAAAVLQWVLHGTALVSEGMKSSSSILGGALLIGAGLFQFTPWKRTCLDQCRSPLTFLLTEWRDGHLGAIQMGIRHGAFCTGCCWLLMILLFVAGVMNMAWVAVITVLVLLEKMLPLRLKADLVCGTLFLLWGAWVLARGW